MGVSLFSVAAMFICFRESLEASVIVSVMLQIMQRLGLPRLKKHVILGAVVGICGAVVVGAVLITVFYVLKNNVFDGNTEDIFEGVVSWLAATLISIVAFAMLRFYHMERKWAAKLKGKVLEVAEGNNAWAVFFLSGSSVFREGVETVIFVGGVSATTAATAIPISAVVGLLLGVTVGIGLYYTGRQIKDLFWFFVISCVILLFIAAGLTSNGTRDFQEAMSFGYFGYNHARLIWYNRFLWNISSCCNNRTDQGWNLAHALLGWEDTPTALQIFSYVGFWVVIGCIFLYKRRQGKLFSRDPKLLAALKEQEDAEAAAQALEAGDKAAGEVEGIARSSVDDAKLDLSADSLGEKSSESSDTARDSAMDVDDGGGIKEHAHIPHEGITNPHEGLPHPAFI